MKLLFIGAYYPTFGGAELHLYELSSLLSKKDKVVILTPRIIGNCPQIKKVEVSRAYTIIKDNKWIKRFRLLEYVQNYSFILPGLFLGSRLMKKHNFDLIHVQFGLSFGILGYLLKKVYRKPLVLTLQGSGLNFKGFKIFFKPLAKLVLNNAEAIIAVSNAIKNEIPINKKAIVIPNSVLVENFKNKGDKNYILAVGRLAPMKGFCYLIEAAADSRLKDFNFYIIGEGPERNNLEKLILKLGLTNVKLLGYLEHKKTLEKVANCSLFVMPSIYGEGLPIALLEAMACEKPVIGTNVRGIPESVLDGKNGFLVPPEDPKALADSIYKILKNKKIKLNMGKNSKKIIIEKFSWAKNINKIKRIYSDLTKN